MIDAWRYTLIPLVATALGAVAATIVRPRDAVVGAIQHFTAGITFAAAAAEGLPDVMRGGIAATLVGGLFGVVAMVFIKAAGAPAKVRTGFRAMVGIDFLVDGLVLGIGFAAGVRAGALLTFALTIEVLFLGLTVATQSGRRWAASLVNSGRHRRARMPASRWRCPGDSGLAVFGSGRPGGLGVLAGRAPLSRHQETARRGPRKTRYGLGDRGFFLGISPHYRDRRGDKVTMLCARSGRSAGRLLRAAARHLLAAATILVFVEGTVAKADGPARPVPAEAPAVAPVGPDRQRAAVVAYLRHIYAIYLGIRSCTELSTQRQDRSFMPLMALDEARRRLRLIDGAVVEVGLDANRIWRQSAPLAEITAEALKRDPDKHLPYCQRMTSLFRMDADNLEVLLQALGSKTSLVPKDY